MPLVAVVLSVVPASYSLVQSPVNPALQPLRADFHASQARIGWVLTAYLLSSAALTPFPGRVGDHIGRERLLAAATGLPAAGSLVAAVGAATCLLVPAHRAQQPGRKQARPRIRSTTNPYWTQENTDDRTTR